MSKLSGDEQGFSGIEIVMVVIIVALIGAVGYLVYKNHHQPAKVVTVTKTVVTPAKSSSSNTDTTTTTINTSDVTNLLTNFYNQFITASASTSKTQPNPPTQVVQQFGTANLISYYTPPTGYSYYANPVVCAQNIPSSFTVSGVTLNQANASANIIEKFGTGTTTVKATIMRQSGNLKIDTITCNPPLVPQKGGN